jgi:hypothetical protein
MSRKMNPVLLIVQDAIAAGRPLEVKTIRELRARSRQAVMAYKAVFWVGIIIFNLCLWVPLPFAVGKTVLYVMAAVALVAALVVPILGLRKHQMSLELLKIKKDPLKKKVVSDAGQVYLEKVKTLDRPLVNAEYSLLDGSKWSGTSGTPP